MPRDRPDQHRREIGQYRLGYRLAAARCACAKEGSGPEDEGFPKARGCGQIVGIQGTFERYNPFLRATIAG